MSKPPDVVRPEPASGKRKPEDYQFLKAIGEGSFSTVYLCREVVGRRFLAVKVCRKKLIIKEKKVDYVKREKQAYQILDSQWKETCPFFVKLACSFQDVSCLYYVLTLADKGDLLLYLNTNGAMDLPCASFYTGELVHALEHMHGLGIIHRDVKPENILLNSAMHIRISDFGSSKILRGPFAPPSENTESNEGSGDGSAASHKRRMSFVGTAQYVSPEILNNWPSTPAADLWALGVVTFQMLANRPPFQAQASYTIFQKILKLEYKFPENFPETAQDLIKKLLVIEPIERLGARDIKVYSSLKAHEFFAGLDFETLYKTTPPDPACKYSKSLLAEDCAKDEDVEPGLSEERLLQVEIMSALGSRKEDPAEVPVIPALPKRKRLTDISPEECKRRLEQQKTDNRWHKFVQGNLILKQGLLDKKKGLFPRRRMFLLTFGPRLFYIDPDHMELKGEVPWSRELRPEAKTTKAFKSFVIHTPHRIYYLEDPAGFALEWCQAIDDVYEYYYGKRESKVP
ncbi:unnamed protein product [Notodromas monacha]|uniref:3-phosphoinositide-dependent protein kinase 1 n=1 Tax=Notodromas monacha TaxID=399045 RepID=A0A7R9BIY1_9CRUS|nr:unnamed protein product [Notodromas monacha]CAG0916400.1 unnamed protein product [Notodromas monacha]